MKSTMGQRWFTRSGVSVNKASPTISASPARQFGDPTFPDNFPVIDGIPNGVATSIKSIDLNAATYQNEASLTHRLNKYVEDVREFNGKDWGGKEVRGADICGRAVRVIVPRGSVTQVKQIVIDGVRANALRNHKTPVDIIVTEY